MERKCIVCGNDNLTSRSKFCSNQCKQQYYYQKNKEQRSIDKKKYYQEHKQEYLERQQKWFENNREKWNEYMQERRKQEKEQEVKENE